MRNNLSLETAGLNFELIDKLTPRLLSLLIANWCNKLLDEIGLETTLEIQRQWNKWVEALIYEEKASFSEQVALHTLTTRWILSGIVINLENHLMDILKALSNWLTNDDLFTVCTVLRLWKFSDRFYEILKKCWVTVYTYWWMKDWQILDENFLILDFNWILYIEWEDQLVNVEKFTSQNGFVYHGIISLYWHHTFIKLDQNNWYITMPIVDIDMSKTADWEYRIIQESTWVYHLVNLKNREVLELWFWNSISDDDWNMRLFHNSSRTIVQDLVDGDFTKVKIISWLDDQTQEVLPEITLH